MAPPFLLHAGFPATVTAAHLAPAYSANNRLTSSVCNLGAPATQWRAGGNHALTSLMDVDQRRRHARFKPVLKKPMVQLDDTYASLLPYLSSPQHSSFSLTPDIFPPQEFESYNCPNTSYLDNYNLLDGYVGNYSDAFMPEFESEVPLPAVGYSENECDNALLDGYVGNYVDALMPELQPEVPLPAVDYRENEYENALLDGYVGNYSDIFILELQPEVPVPAVGGRINESENVTTKKESSGRSLSAQSIAARERRRKITEKTQELGKLIPGGNKMSTAEMLGSAFNYVKFMQAQLQLLQLMQQGKESNKEDLLTNELQVLVTSPKVQEKLYSEKKCLVPSEFIHGIADPNDEIRQFC
ncbi:basic helix-loop-helix (bHLH) DNA-binding superfamily protein [Euphorbia peplus]|nr:basic helix-loop-helix (bHLH) DNA-binding superfamily protein [Euphorbia peplus]